MTPIPEASRRRIDYMMCGCCLRIVLRPQAAVITYLSRAAEPV